ncbi:hypothetical protein ACFYTG_37960 [Streptomyces mirabilis]|uniref:hypothetical protein n=1 Tax=Streptomyces mirabilis TaxID=68239 RepID=UPI00368638C9
MSGPADWMRADWATLTALAPGAQANQYWVRLTPGADVGAYVKAGPPTLVSTRTRRPR